LAERESDVHIATAMIDLDPAVVTHPAIPAAVTFDSGTHVLLLSFPGERQAREVARNLTAAAEVERHDRLVISYSGDPSPTEIQAVTTCRADVAIGS
jgi:hypothetical protein